MTRAGTRLRFLPLFCALFILPLPDAAAQPAEPIGPYVVDARGTFARFKGTPTVASALGSTSDAMPTRGLGLATGAHWYPVRLGPVTVGLGGEVVLARGSHTAELADATAGAPTIATRFSLVFTFDVRFYTIAAQEVAALRPAYPRMRFMVFSVGVSLR
jgi:hypothetical protein